MPHLCSQDLRLLETIESWKRDAVEGVANERDRQHFWSATHRLCGEITLRFPKLDLSPLHEIYDGVIGQNWSKDISAVTKEFKKASDRGLADLPPDDPLVRRMDIAVLVLDSVERVLMSQGQGEPKERLDDGPYYGQIIFHGKAYPCPKGAVYNLIEFFWSKDYASFATLGSECLDELQTSIGTIRTYCSRANNRLRKIGIPWHLSVEGRGEWVKKVQDSQ